MSKRHGAKAGRRVRPTTALLATVLAVLVGAGGWLSWQVWGTDATARPRAASQVSQMRDGWSDVPATPAESGVGERIGIISIPKLGLQWPIVAGVGTEQLQQGVGWYPSTAWPGESGNAALAGLRVTHGSPFRNLLELSVGDEVIVETAKATLYYKIVVEPASLTVQSDEGWVLDAVPGHPDVAPSQPWLTLTTAQDLVATGDRSVAFASLERRVPR